MLVTIMPAPPLGTATKTPPAPVMIKRAVNLAKGSAEPNKMPDLNAFDVAAAVRSVKGAARSMGVEAVG